MLPVVIGKIFNFVAFILKHICVLNLSKNKFSRIWMTHNELQQILAAWLTWNLSFGAEKSSKKFFKQISITPKNISLHNKCWGIKISKYQTQEQRMHSRWVKEFQIFLDFSSFYFFWFYLNFKYSHWNNRNR